jgi:hypothetical protein
VALGIIVAIVFGVYLVLERTQPTRSIGAPSLAFPLNTAAPSVIETQPSANTISVRWRPSDLAPATTAGRICLTTEATARLCASYALGEKPADALTRELERRGLRVESSG